MNVQQGPAKPKDDLVTHVAKIMREDISILHNSQDVSLRQPPIHEDDHDSWGDSQPLENWFYAAKSIIEAIDHYRSEQRSI